MGIYGCTHHKLTEKLHQLEQENAELKETVDNILEHSPDLQVTTFQNGRYTVLAVMNCYHYMLGLKQ